MGHTSEGTDSLHLPKAATTLPQAATTLPQAATTLPQAGPMLVLFACTDSEVMVRLDAITADLTTGLDLRSTSAWSEVTDGHKLLELFLADPILSGPLAAEIRVSFAPLDAPSEQLMLLAVRAPTLQQLASAKEAFNLATNPPKFETRFQPLVDLQSPEFTVLGYESLIRARANGVLLDAEELIGRADRCGWLPELDELARTLAVKNLGPWLGQGLLFLNMMAPNGEFDVAAIRATINAAWSEGISPDQIVLEATEHIRYRSIPAAAKQIDELRQLGVRIAVDDVGDGYSSLLVVSAFKPDVLKLAGSLVASLDSPEGKAVVKAVVAMAHETGAWVVAENIETAAQAKRARLLGIDWGQGHFFGSPAVMPLDQHSLRPVT